MTTRPPPPSDYQVSRLGSSDVALAKALFAMMATVFEQEPGELSDAYVERFLAREDTWVIAATSGNDVVGGITAHVLPMTRAESYELFIYDVAVRVDHQRCGVGRRMMEFLQRAKAEAGLSDVFVPADNEDQHALDFYRAVGGTATPVTFFTFA